MTTTGDVDVVRLGLRRFVVDAFLYMRPELVLSDDDDLVDLRIIDSLGFVELVDEVQARYGVTVDDLEITREHFGSISAIAAFVHRKRGDW